MKESKVPGGIRTHSSAEQVIICEHSATDAPKLINKINNKRHDGIVVLHNIVTTNSKNVSYLKFMNCVHTLFSFKSDAYIFSDNVFNLK